MTETREAQASSLPASASTSVNSAVKDHRTAGDVVAAQQPGQRRRAPPVGVENGGVKAQPQAAGGEDAVGGPTVGVASHLPRGAAASGGRELQRQLTVEVEPHVAGEAGLAVALAGEGERGRSRSRPQATPPPASRYVGHESPGFR